MLLWYFSNQDFFSPLSLDACFCCFSFFFDHIYVAFICRWPLCRTGTWLVCPFRAQFVPRLTFSAVNELVCRVGIKSSQVAAEKAKKKTLWQKSQITISKVLASLTLRASSVKNDNNNYISTASRHDLLTACVALSCSAHRHTYTCMYANELPSFARLLIYFEFFSFNRNFILFLFAVHFNLQQIIRFICNIYYIDNNYNIDTYYEIFMQNYIVL